MGFEKFKRPVAAPGFRQTQAVQSISGSGVSTAAALGPINVQTQTAVISTTGSGAGFEVALTAGRLVGTSLTVNVSANSTVPTVLLLESTTQVFHGSTFNALQFSTDSSGASAMITKVSTSAYVVNFGGSAVTLAASTGTV